MIPIGVNENLAATRRRNCILNSLMLGAVAGTPGTPATGQANAFDSAFVNVAGSGIEDGLDYIDLRFAGDFSSFALKTYQFIPYTTGIPGFNAGTRWTLSFYAKLIAGSDADFATLASTVWQVTSGGSYISNPFDFYGFTKPPTSGPLRQASGRRVSTLTLDPTAAVGAIGIAAEGNSSSPTADATYRIGGIQFEPGNYATPYIRNPRTAFARLV